MARQEGYYWVKYKGEKWHTHYFDGEFWENDVAFDAPPMMDMCFSEINETRIPTPDEKAYLVFEPNENSTIEEIEAFEATHPYLFAAFFKLYRHRE